MQVRRLFGNGRVDARSNANTARERDRAAVARREGVFTTRTVHAVAEREFSGISDYRAKLHANCKELEATCVEGKQTIDSWIVDLMALAAKRRCPEPGCPELTEGGRCKQHRYTAHERHASSERQKEHGGWYSKKAWRDFRAWFVSKHPLCVQCKLDGRATPVDQVDHIFGREEQPQWALTEEACQSLCYGHHTQKTVRQTANGYQRYVVCGPPCSGKTTWVRRFRTEDSYAWDADETVLRLTGTHGHDQDWTALKPEVDQLRAQWEQRAKQHSGMVFEIATYPKTAWAMATALGAEVVVMNVEREECLRRLRQSGRARQLETERIIDDWYATIGADSR